MTLLGFHFSGEINGTDRKHLTSTSFYASSLFLEKLMQAMNDCRQRDAKDRYHAGKKGYFSYYWRNERIYLNVDI